MQFTPQQLSGGNSYSKGVEVGNWNEDDEDRSSLFERNLKEQGATADRAAAPALLQHRHKMIICNGATEITHYCPTECAAIRYGGTVMLESIGSEGGFLACDTFEEIVKGSREYLVTVTPQHNVVNRTTFTILPVRNKNLLDCRIDPPEGATLGQPIGFGQAFHISCNRAFLENTSSGNSTDQNENQWQPGGFVLSSTFKSGHSATRSLRQVVCLKAGETAETVWKFRAPVESKKGAITAVNNLKLPVPVGEPVIIEHRQTGKPLFCKKATKQYTDFGLEFEVSCHSQVSVGRNQQLLSEANGSRTARSANKVDAAAVKWVIR